MTTITSIETIRIEAQAAAKAGQSPRDACPYPFASVQAAEWRKHYEAAANTFENALAQYRAAIEADA